MIINKNKKGFTLIELLVVISIIGVLIAISMFSFQNTRKSGRDAKRKSDLELIRSGIEIYKADCGSYPTTLTPGSSLKGDGSSSSCSVDNTYINQIPADTMSSEKSYFYVSDSINYELCAALEVTPLSPDVCSGTCGDTCNYKVTNP